MSPISTKTPRIIQVIDQFTNACGKLISLLTFAMVVTTTAVVLLRYCFGSGSIFLQESITYMHATVFMLCCAYTFLHGGHVRVDILYRKMSPQAQAWVNALGCIVFLLPFCAFLVYISLDFTLTSWKIREISSEPGGIPAVFLLKSLMPLMPCLLALQGISETLRASLILIYPQPSEQ